MRFVPYHRGHQRQTPVPQNRRCGSGSSVRIRNVKLWRGKKRPDNERKSKSVSPDRVNHVQTKRVIVKPAVDMTKTIGIPREMYLFIYKPNLINTTLHSIICFIFSLRNVFTVNLYGTLYVLKC